MLFDPFLLPRFKQEIISENSVLSVGVMNNDSTCKKDKEVIKIFFLGKSDEGLNSDSKFRKIITKDIWEVRGLGIVLLLSDMTVEIACDSYLKSLFSLFHSFFVRPWKDLVKWIVYFLEHCC